MRICLALFVLLVFSFSAHAATLEQEDRKYFTEEELRTIDFYDKAEANQEKPYFQNVQQLTVSSADEFNKLDEDQRTVYKNAARDVCYSRQDEVPAVLSIIHKKFKSKGMMDETYDFDIESTDCSVDSIDLKTKKSKALEGYRLKLKVTAYSKSTGKVKNEIKMNLLGAVNPGQKYFIYKRFIFFPIHECCGCGSYFNRYDLVNGEKIDDYAVLHPGADMEERIQKYKEQHP